MHSALMWVHRIMLRSSVFLSMTFSLTAMLWRIAVTTITEQLLEGFSFTGLADAAKTLHPQSYSPLHYRACPSMGLIEPFLCKGGWMLHRCQEVWVKRISTVSQQPAITKPPSLQQFGKLQNWPIQKSHVCIQAILPQCQ